MSEHAEPSNAQPQPEQTRTEKFTVSGENLVKKVRELVAEGNVRRIILANDEGHTLLEVPLNAGLAVTTVAAILAPVIVAIGAIAALLTSVTITVVRSVPAVEPASEPAPSETTPPAPAA